MPNAQTFDAAEAAPLASALLETPSGRTIKNSRRAFLRQALLGAGALALSPVLARAGAIPAATDKIIIPTDPRMLKFRVLWKGDDIGQHVTTITPTADGQGMTVATKIGMKVKVGFITAFRYEHDSTEIWRDGRLLSLASKTHDDGDDLAVKGEATADGFKAVGPKGPFIAPAESLTTNCMWLPTLVDEKKLIDAQNGVMVGLVSTPLGTDRVSVRGKDREAQRHSIRTPFVAGSLWYDRAGNWVGSRLEIKGETLDYKLAT
jgi:Family of unknown function (DUF6134)